MRKNKPPLKSVNSIIDTIDITISKPLTYKDLNQIFKDTQNNPLPAKVLYILIKEHYNELKCLKLISVNHFNLIPLREFVEKDYFEEFCGKIFKRCENGDNEGTGRPRQSYASTFMTRSRDFHRNSENSIILDYFEDREAIISNKVVLDELYQVTTELVKKRRKKALVQVNSGHRRSPSIPKMSSIRATKDGKHSHSRSSSASNNSNFSPGNVRKMIQNIDSLATSKVSTSTSVSVASQKPVSKLRNDSSDTLFNTKNFDFNFFGLMGNQQSVSNEIERKGEREGSPLEPELKNQVKVKNIKGDEKLIQITDGQVHERVSTARRYTKSSEKSSNEGSDGQHSFEELDREFIFLGGFTSFIFFSQK